MQTSEFAPNKMESEHVLHHLCIQDSAAFCQPSGGKLPYKLQRLSKAEGN